MSATAQDLGAVVEEGRKLHKKGSDRLPSLRYHTVDQLTELSFGCAVELVELCGELLDQQATLLSAATELVAVREEREELRVKFQALLFIAEDNDLRGTQTLREIREEWEAYEAKAEEVEA
ncbi:hypothetical protein EON81_17415 [bacterium]|nr:MAG: hypothetical protein EON81_17415 [bacterium]